MAIATLKEAFAADETAKASTDSNDKAKAVALYQMAMRHTLAAVKCKIPPVHPRTPARPAPHTQRPLAPTTPPPPPPPPPPGANFLTRHASRSRRNEAASEEGTDRQG